VTAYTGGHLSVRGIARDIVAAYRRHWGFLIVSAIVVLLPQSLIDALLDGLELEGFKSAKDVAVVAAIPLTVAVNLFGQAVYAGLTAAVVVDWRAGMPLPKISALVRALPIGGLVILDVLATAGIAVGVLLLIVPGLLYATYFGIAPAIMKFERRGVLGSLRRSAQLVRGNFWRVCALVVGVLVSTEAIVALVSFSIHGLGLLTAADLVADGLTQPIEGLAIALVAIRLLELHGEAPEPEALARALTHGAE
jgi:hypothetical protein